MAGKTFLRKKALKTKVSNCGQKNKALPVLTLRSKLLGRKALSGIYNLCGGSIYVL